MRINFELDTSSPHDLAQLGVLSSAFNGGSLATVPATASVAAPPPVPGRGVAPSNATPNVNPDTAAGNTNAPRVTIEQVRAVFATKKKEDNIAAMASMGFDGLSKVPADRLGELMELVKKNANK
jgi:hypothetical protein